MNEYGESHQNPVNKGLHWVCVPAIVLSLLALLWAIPVPAVFEQWPLVNWATLMVLATLIFYVRLGLPFVVGMLALAALCFWLIILYENHAPWPLWLAALVVFVVAWIGQFIGHHVEGKKPSFFKDLQFLLVGPAWLMGFVFRRLGIAFK